MMYLLDTNTFTHFHSGNPKIARHREALSDPEIGTTIITKIEVLRGRFEFLVKATSVEEFLRAQSLLIRSEEMLSEFPVVFLDQVAVTNFTRLRNTKGFKKHGRADLLIAGIVLAQKATLVTRNVKDFSGIPNLKVVNWLD
jgi:tRNA(fMet)-specific endonuclease VapC